MLNDPRGPKKKRAWSKRYTWAELERQGIKRCCVMFSDGTRCRRRAAETIAGPSGGDWCAKHAPIMKAHTDYANAAIAAQKREDDK